MSDGADVAGLRLGSAGDPGWVRFAAVVELGWQRAYIEIIDDDLAVSGSGAARSGFDRLVAEVGLGHVDLVLAIDVSRLAKNNRAWYQLLDLCALVPELPAHHLEAPLHARPLATGAWLAFMQGITNVLRRWPRRALLVGGRSEQPRCARHSGPTSPDATSFGRLRRCHRPLEENLRLYQPTGTLVGIAYVYQSLGCRSGAACA